MVENRDTKLIEDILRLKRQRKAIILAHNYQLGEVQDIADFVGDSLGLSQNAAKTDADVIVFCGVHFMAETASILCPDKYMPLSEEGIFQALNSNLFAHTSCTRLLATL